MAKIHPLCEKCRHGPNETEPPLGIKCKYVGEPIVTVHSPKGRKTVSAPIGGGIPGEGDVACARCMCNAGVMAVVRDLGLAREKKKPVEGVGYDIAPEDKQRKIRRVHPDGNVYLKTRTNKWEHLGKVEDGDIPEGYKRLMGDKGYYPLR